MCILRVCLKLSEHKASHSTLGHIPCSSYTVSFFIPTVRHHSTALTTLSVRATCDSSAGIEGFNAEYDGKVLGHSVTSSRQLLRRRREVSLLERIDSEKEGVDQMKDVQGENIDNAHSGRVSGRVKECGCCRQFIVDV